MLQILTLVSLLTIITCQSSPTRYVLPSYTGLEEQDEVSEEQTRQYIKPTSRRTERIPPNYFDEPLSDEDYYHPQARQTVDTSTPSHKDYEAILKTNHLARLRVAAKKHNQVQQNPQPYSGEQYLKEVNPTTKTNYERPAYLRFTGHQQSGLSVPHQEQSKEAEAATPIRERPQQPYRYVLQSDLQSQQNYPQYQQYETPQQEEVKTQPQPKTPHFNLVAYQNALIAQQKLLAAETHQVSLVPKSSIYVSQDIDKKTVEYKKPKAPVKAQPEYEYYPQSTSQTAETPVSVKYQPSQSNAARNIYHNVEAPNYPVEDPSSVYIPKEVEYQTPAPPTPQRQRATKAPFRRTKQHQTEAPAVEEYQQAGNKYELEEQYESQPTATSKYQANQSPGHRGLAQKPTAKYSSVASGGSDDSKQLSSDAFLQFQAALANYQALHGARRQYQPATETRLQPKYVGRQQYREESQQQPQYQQADLGSFQHGAAPSRHLAGSRGPSVSYRQELANSNVRYFRDLMEAPVSYVE